MEDRIRIETSNIKAELNKIIEDFLIDPSRIDFEIIDTKIIQTQDGIKPIFTVDFIQRQPDILCKIIDVEIDESIPQKNAFVKVDCTNLDKPLDVNLDYIIHVIKKKLAFNGIVYGIKENNFPLIAKEIQKRLNPNFTKFKVLIAIGTPPIDGKNSELKTFFQLNTVGQIDEKGNINFKEKNFAIGVDVGTVIAQYIKPTKGIDGYDIFGNILKAKDGKEIQKINIRIDTADIDKVEDETSIKFISKKKGSLIQKNGIFHVEENVKVDRADIKTGNIDLKNVSDVNIGVIKNDIEEDIVGAGIKVTGKKVVVNGNVGPKAYIEAETVDIKGSVHQEATIKAKIARIKNLNGTLIAEEAFIENANYANIETENKVTIDNCLACNIVSPSVEIKKDMLSSNIVTSSKEVILNNVVGNNNKILIKPLEIKQVSAQYKKLLIQEKALSNEIKMAQSTIDMLKQKLDSNLRNFSESIKLIRQLQAKGAKVPTALLNSVKNFKEIEDSYKEQKSKLASLEEQYKDIIHKIKELQDSYKFAHIIIKGEIDAENLIEFDDTLSRRLINKQRSIKIYVREIDGKDQIVIEPLSL
ncbi:FapA family protein [Desulfurella sp.]|uniref:FapA family protein n=1 Tax=Desulfurella sp. TaxID=1962857 RepID=UPI0025C03B62|nr:FapA family protein [Desulfurella sp.]